MWAAKDITWMHAYTRLAVGAGAVTYLAWMGAVPEAASRATYSEKKNPQQALPVCTVDSTYSQAGPAM